MHRESQVEPSKGTVGPGRRPLGLIIADDEPDTVLMLATIMADEGHNVVSVHNGYSVLAAASKELPDAIIVDIDMPGISGWTVAREIRAIYGERSPLLIAISGKWIGQTDRVLSELAGFSHFLSKPCDPRVVIGLLEPLRRLPPSTDPGSAEDTVVPRATTPR